MTPFEAQRLQAAPVRQRPMAVRGPSMPVAQPCATLSPDPVCLHKRAYCTWEPTARDRTVQPPANLSGGATINGDITAFYSLGIALGLGLLIGLERGWKEREQAEGQRIAGIRTFALIGLLGGAWGLLAHETGTALLAVAFASVAVVLAVAYALTQHRAEDPDIGITGIIAALLAFAFGAMAGLGHGPLAAAGAVVTTILLGLKPVLHAWVRRLEERELYAALKLLVISVVILPLPCSGRCWP